MNTQEMTTALTDAAPFLQQLTSAGLTRTLDPTDAKQMELRSTLVEFGKDLVASRIITRQKDNAEQPYAVDPTGLAEFVSKNGTMDAGQLVVSMGKAMTEIGRQESVVLEHLPEERRAGFIDSYHGAARAAYNMGASLDVKAVTGFGREAIGSALIDERRAESVASDESLDTVRRSLTNVVEGMHLSGASFGSDSMGRSMRAMVENAKTSLSQAGYVLPGETEARTQPFSEQVQRGSRENSETIAGSARMLSEAFATPGALESIRFPEGRTLGGVQGLQIHAKGLEQSVDGVETSAAEIRSLRGRYMMTPEQASVAIDLLVASANVTGQARLGMNTEMAFEESRSGMVRVDRSDMGSVKPKMERVYGIDSEPTDAMPAKKGRSSASLEGEISSFAPMTDDAPMTNAVGTVLVPAKAMMDLQDAFKRAKEVDLVGVIDHAIPAFGEARDAQQAVMAGTSRLRRAEGAAETLAEDAGVSTKRTVMSEQEYAKKDMMGLEINAQAAIDEQNRVPFSSEKQAKHYADMVDAAGGVVASKGFVGKSDVVVTDTAMQALSGHTDYILDNFGYHHLAMLAGRSIAEIEKVADAREPAMYATQEEASKAMQPETPWEKPDAALRQMHIAKPVMSVSDWNAYVERQGENSSEVRALNNKVVYFDPNLPLNERAPVPENVKGSNVMKSLPGLVDLADAKNSPVSLEDQVHGRTDLHRAMIARMTRPDGEPNLAFLNQLTALQEKNVGVIVSDHVQDARMLRSAAQSAQQMFDASIKAQDDRWVNDPKVPKGTITMDAQEVKSFVKQARMGNSDESPVLAVRQGKTVLEHPEAASVSGREQDMEQAKSWTAPRQRDGKAETGLPAMASRGPGVTKFSSPKLDLDMLDQVSSGARDTVTFKIAGTRMLDVVADVPRARSKDQAERE